MSVWRSTTATLALIFGLAALAAAQEACLRPVPPEEIPPPQDDPEFRAFLNREHQAYLLGMQDYLNCLGREHDSATHEVDQVMRRWLRLFGDEAVIRHREGPVD